MRNTQIPKGIYCYDENGLCPHWDKIEGQPEQMDGYCHFLKRGDWEEDHLSLLWDQVKECGENMDDDYEDDSQ